MMWIFWPIFETIFEQIFDQELPNSKASLYKKTKKKCRFQKVEISNKAQTWSIWAKNSD